MNEEHRDDVSTHTEQQSSDYAGESVVVQGVPEASRNVIIGTVIAVVVVVLALMYMWGSSVEEHNTQIQTEIEQTIPAETQEEIVEVSSVDDIEVIEAELEATELEALDAELEQIELELEQMLAE